MRRSASYGFLIVGLLAMMVLGLAPYLWEGD